MNSLRITYELETDESTSDSDNSSINDDIDNISNCSTVPLADLDLKLFISLISILFAKLFILYEIYMYIHFYVICACVCVCVLLTDDY